MIRGVLLDIGGVLYVGERALPGAVGALARLRAALPVRFLTNTTRSSRRTICTRLAAMDIEVAAGELFVPATAVRAHLTAQGMSAHLLVHPALREDLAGIPAGTPPAAVVVGDAGEAFDYASLNTAFRHLVAGAELFALAANRSFRDADGGLSLDAGPFVHALEYASGCRARVFGKPSPDFYASALRSLGCAAGVAIMVGDDVEADVAGAMAGGMHGLLVRTGKYVAGAEATIAPAPTMVVEDFPAAVDWILAHAG
ncbi:MAG: TIGR01458 family HAD-type hydrolase [Gammaproteobacteria bacterium]|nr:TIGR01458 family HAD-type hydrolase [Gammaproteobacteria bacterium]